MTPVRLQRSRLRGWRLPHGAIYVGRPSLFGNPWTMVDAVAFGVPPELRAGWLVRRYREELEHGGLLSDWADRVSDARFEVMFALFDGLCPPVEGRAAASIRPLFRYLLRDATALACWCPVDAPCHADALIELGGDR